MQWRWLVRLTCFLALLQLLVTPAWAYKLESRVPLFGYRGNITAKGSARYMGKFREPDTRHFEELVIEVKYVPLTPGTVLAVYVDKEMIGQLTITEHQTGTLRVTSEQRKYVPPIEPGSSVRLMKTDGTIVMQ